MKSVFLCSCATCRRDGGGGACFFVRSRIRLHDGVTWVRTSGAACRGYSRDGRLVAMRYAWADYLRVRPNLVAVPVPFALIAYVYVVSVLMRLGFVTRGWSTGGGQGPA